MAFDEIQFPTEISYGAIGGPAFKTKIVVAASGFEQRNASWSKSRGRWNVAQGLKSPDDLVTLIAFFYAREARARGFRFKDWTDFKHDMKSTPATFIQFGTGDGTAGPFQVNKSYVSGAITKVRDITKIQENVTTFNVYVDGVLQVRATDYTVDLNTGKVTFLTPFPTAGQLLQWSGEFDVPVRFDMDEMETEIEFFEIHNWEVPIVEVRVDL